MKLTNVQTLKLNQDCNLLPPESDQADFLVKFKYHNNKVSRISFFDKNNKFICSITSKEIDDISFDALSKRNKKDLKNNLLKSNVNSNIFKESLLNLFFYNMFIAN